MQPARGMVHGIAHPTARAELFEGFDVKLQRMRARIHELRATPGRASCERADELAKRFDAIRRETYRGLDAVDERTAARLNGWLRDFDRRRL